MEREINPDLIKNVQKYIDWMPQGLKLEISFELTPFVIDDMRGAKYEPASIAESLAFIIAAMSRSPTQSGYREQTEWVRRIIEDLRITQELMDSPAGESLGNNISHFITGKKRWNQGYCSGWNGEMWGPLLSLFQGIKPFSTRSPPIKPSLLAWPTTESDFLEMEKSGGVNYGIALREIIFSEGQRKVNFINWMWENPFEVKQ